MNNAEIKNDEVRAEYPKTMLFEGEERTVNSWYEENRLIKMMKRKNGEILAD